MRRMIAPYGNHETTGKLLAAIRSTETVSGYTHTFYRYPARFSPIFAREVIDTFSRPGDIVVDPFMGSGTTLVEAKALGRKSIGSDVSSLAVFLAKAKTAVVSETDREAVVKWAHTVSLGSLNLRNIAFRDEEWIEDGYQRNIDGRSTWAIRKTVELALGELAILENEHQQMLVRCAILRTAQWALDCRKTVPTATQFRAQLHVFIHEMVAGAKQFSRACRKWSGGATETLCLHQSATTLDATYKQTGFRPPSLVLTSPPYPGVHIVYHRWQILGRRETPAPFWIAGTKDGAGASFYTFGDRQQNGLATYFDTALKAFKSVANIADHNTIVVQMVAFSDPKSQLRRYLEVMNEAGFQEIDEGQVAQIPGRTWRAVPNRKWYVASQRKNNSSSEVVLFHRLTRRNVN